MTHIKISPVAGIIYPDNNGYTGFSIFYWNTHETPLDKLMFDNQWGAFRPDRVYDNIPLKGSYFMEARFFVFGSLLSHILIIEKEEKEIKDCWSRIWNVWKPIMDTILKNISELMDEENRSGVRIDEVVTPEIMKLLEG